MIGLGNDSPEALEAATDSPTGPACQASLSAFRSALVFRNVFTALVAVLAGLTLIALAYCIYRIVDKGWNPTATFTALGGAVTGTGAVFLQRERTKSIKALREALEDVGKYCGMPVKEELT